MTAPVRLLPPVRLLSPVELLSRARLLQPLEAGLVLYLPFWEGAGLFAEDVSPFRNNGTINGASWVNGVIGKALNYSIAGDYVNIPYSSSLDNFDEFTLEAWIYPTSLNDGKFHHIIDKGWQIAGAFVLFINDTGYVGFATRDTAQHASYGIVLQLNTWYHIVGIFKKGTKNNIYINGLWGGESDITDNTTMTLNSAVTISASANYFQGIIDEVRIYNRALSSAEVLATYYRGARKNY